MANFQTSVGSALAPAVAGDFAGYNIRNTVLAGPGGLIAGLAGLNIGRFAWLDGAHDIDGTLTYANSFGFTAPDGFVAREQQGLITTFLQENGMFIPAGYMATLYISGDFWVQNDGAAIVYPGDTLYANYADGKIGNAAVTSSSTGSIAAGTGSATANIVAGSDVLNVTGTVTGGFYPGGVLSGTGIISGTKILEQISGTANGIGTYRVSKVHDTAVAATTVSETHGVYTAASALSGVIGVGDILSGSGVTANTKITQLGTGTGGLGTYIVDTTQTATSTTITGAKNVSTKWIARSQGAVGGLFKMSSHLHG